MSQSWRNVPCTRREAYWPPDGSGSTSIGLRLRLPEAVGKAMLPSGASSSEGHRLQIHRMAPKLSRAMSRS